MATATAQTVPTRPSLLARIKDWRDDEGWREFCTNYRGLIHGFAIRRGLPESEVEDVVQDTFLSVAKSIQEFNYDPARCAFKTWLMDLTSKRISDHFRKRQRAGRLGMTDPAMADQKELDSIPDPAPGELSHQWDEEWNRNLIEVALEHLKPQVDAKQFGVFYLHVIKDQPVRQVAKSYGVSSAYVYLVKHRLKRMFERALRSVQKGWT